jgi:hypothetical protein
MEESRDDYLKARDTWIDRVSTAVVVALLWLLVAGGLSLFRIFPWRPIDLIGWILTVVVVPIVWLVCLVLHEYYVEIEWKPRREGSKRPELVSPGGLIIATASVVVLYLLWAVFWPTVRSIVGPHFTKW